MRILVTGASGFLGKSLIRRWAQVFSQNMPNTQNTQNIQNIQNTCIAAVRRGKLASLRASGALQGIDDGDLAHVQWSDTWDQEQYDAVIHCAGGGRAVTYADFVKNNVETTQQALACLSQDQHQPRYFVLVSSLTARGPGSAADTDQETAPLTGYGKSKKQAEECVWKFVEEKQQNIYAASVRPPAIYGIGDDRMLGLFRTAKYGFMPYVHSDGKISMIHVDDCADAIWTTLQYLQTHPAGNRHIFYTEDGQEYRPRDMANILAHAINYQSQAEIEPKHTAPKHVEKLKKIRLLKMPTPILHVAGHVSESIARITQKAAFLTTDKVQDLSQKEWLCSAKTLHTSSGWTPQHTFAQTAGEMASWYRAQGLL